MALNKRVYGIILLPVFFAESAFRYEDCSVRNSAVNIPIFSLMPDPVDMQQNLSINLRGEILQDIPDSAKLEIKYYRIHRVFGVQLDLPIPCILGKYGSCSLPLCEYVERYRPQVCPFLGNGTTCECPPKAGSYGGNSVEVKVAEINSVARFIVKGRYRTEVRLKDGDTEEELACFKVYTELS